MFNINPYNVGKPIQTPKQLFGREIIFATIADSLAQDTKFILLHGQRRVGKSSVLKHIPHFVGEKEFVFVFCDLENHSHSTLSEILYDIASHIFNTLEMDRSIINSLNAEELNDGPRIFKRKFLRPILDKLYNSKLVLLLDEFDVIQNDQESALALLNFFKDLVKKQDNIFLIAVVGRYLNLMPNLVQLFRDSPFQEIGLLDHKSAEKLIIEPANQILQYQREAIIEIIKLSSGHPYCIQGLCYNLFCQARNKGYNVISDECVNEIIDQAIEHLSGGFASLWEGLSISERVVVLAVAETKNIVFEQDQAVQDPLQLLINFGLELTEDIEKAVQILINKSFFDSNPIKFKVELFRRWLIKHHELREEISNLEAIESEDVGNFLLVARKRWEKNLQQDALNSYEDALKTNPNNFTTIVELADKYLELKNFDPALKLYERAYKVDPVLYKEKFTDALFEFAYWLGTEKEYKQVKQIYHRILNEIDPNNRLANEKLRDLKSFQNNLCNIMTKLADKHLQLEEFNEALELYSQVYQIDIQYREKFRDVLLQFGEFLINQGKYNEAKEQYNFILDQVEPGNIIARNQLKQIQNFKFHKSTIRIVPLIQRIKVPRLLTPLIIIFTIIGTGSKFLFQDSPNICPTGQLKNSNGDCASIPIANPTPKITDKISSGDRTLFTEIINVDRDQGIEYFKKGDYIQAEKRFRLGVTSDPNKPDPEVLIYQNNSLARQKGKSLVLAVIVPVTSRSIPEKEAAKEILRGIAQAQNQFNTQRGLKQKDRLLLEVIIVDNGSDDNQTKQVAEELVKNESLLGIIVYNSSSNTTAALPVYSSHSLAVISLESSSNQLEDKESNLFRTIPSDTVSAKRLAEYIRSKLKLKEVVIFCNPSDPYSDSMKEEFRVEFGKLDGKVINKPCTNLADPNFSSYKAVKEIQKEAQAIVLFPDIQHTNTAIEIAKYNNANSKLHLLGGSSLYAYEILNQNPDILEGLFLVVPWFSRTPESKSFADEAKNLWRGDVSWRTATSFDATKAFIESFELSSKPSKKLVLDNLPDINLPPSKTSGEELKFNDEKSREKSILVEVKRGKFSLIQEPE